MRADAVEVVPRIVRHYGEPFADSSAIPSFYLSELTRRHVTVALNGDGGDESFAGYQRYVANAVAGRLDRIPAPLRHAARRGSAAGFPTAATCPATANRVPPPRRLARPRRGGALHALRVVVRRRAARRALHAGVRRRAARRRRRRGDRGPLGGGVRGLGGRPHARGRRVDLPRRRPDREGRHRHDGARARGALAAARSRADGAGRLDPRATQGPRRREEVDLPRGAAPVAAVRDPRPPEAGILGAAVELAADRPAGLGARHPARPEPRSSADASSRRRYGGCWIAMPPGPTATPSGSTRC